MATGMVIAVVVGCSGRGNGRALAACALLDLAKLLLGDAQLLSVLLFPPSTLQFL